jgi:polysaccharide transporter, PST family
MKDQVIKGTFIVTILSLVVKILSVVYKMPYQNVTGDIGFYIYQQVYPLFAILVSISTYALPLVISEILVRNNYQVNFSFLFKRLMGLSIFGAVFIFLFRESIADLLNDHNLVPLLGVLALVCLLTPISGLLRGLLNSYPISISKVGISLLLEQSVRVLVTLGVLYLFYNNRVSNLYQVANLSYLGLFIGIVVAICYLYVVQKKNNIPIPRDGKILIRTISFRIFTLILSASILVVFQLVDSFTITRRLSKLIAFTHAIEMKGIYDRGLPLIQVAIFFVSPLIAAYLPHIKGYNIKKEYGTLIEFIFLLALPATVGLIMVFTKVNNLLFKGDALHTTLQISLVAIVIYAIILALTALPGNSQSTTPILMGGIALKLLLNIILINSKLGIMGASISTILGLLFIVVSLMIARRELIQIDSYNLIKISLATFIMGMYLYVSNFIPIMNTLFLQIIISIIVYTVSIFILNACNARKNMDIFSNKVTKQ